MKKFISIAMMLISTVAVLWISYAILHYGAVNMRRVEAQAYEYRMHWADRR